MSETYEEWKKKAVEEEIGRVGRMIEEKVKAQASLGELEEILGRMDLSYEAQLVVACRQNEARNEHHLRFVLMKLEGLR